LPFDRRPVASRTSRRNNATWRKKSRTAAGLLPIDTGHIRHHARLRSDSGPLADPQMTRQTRLATADVVFRIWNRRCRLAKRSSPRLRLTLWPDLHQIVEARGGADRVSSSAPVDRRVADLHIVFNTGQAAALRNPSPFGASQTVWPMQAPG
jgi:hypothetical protein